MSLERIDRWGEVILERGIKQGVEQGIERQKALLRHQAEWRFGPAVAERLSPVSGSWTAPPPPTSWPAWRAPPRSGRPYGQRLPEAMFCAARSK